MEEVIVSVIGTQRDLDGDENRIELVSVGRRHEKGGVSYITYKEELSGMDKTTTMLKLYPDRVILIRTGSYEQKQEFFPGRKTYSMYTTPYGSLELGVATRELSMNESSKENSVSSQTISIQYELEIDGRWQSSNSLKICVAKAGTK